MSSSSTNDDVFGSDTSVSAGPDDGQPAVVVAGGFRVRARFRLSEVSSGNGHDTSMAMAQHRQHRGRRLAGLLGGGQFAPRQQADPLGREGGTQFAHHLTSESISAAAAPRATLRRDHSRQVRAFLSPTSRISPAMRTIKNSSGSRR